MKFPENKKSKNKKSSAGRGNKNRRLTHQQKPSKIKGRKTKTPRRSRGVGEQRAGTLGVLPTKREAARRNAGAAKGEKANAKS
jgi:hypothetical protein